MSTFYTWLILATMSGSSTAKNHKYFLSHWVMMANWSHTYCQCFRWNLPLNNQRQRTTGFPLSICSGSCERHFMRRILEQIADNLVAPFSVEVNVPLSGWYSKSDGIISIKSQLRLRKFERPNKLHASQLDLQSIVFLSS